MNFTKNYGQDPNYVGTKLKPVKFYDSDRGEKTGQQDVSIANTLQKTEITPITALDHAHITAPISFASTVSDKDFEQATALWHIMGQQDGARLRLANNVAAHVSGVKEKWVREEVYVMFGKVDANLGEMIRNTTETKIQGNLAHPHKTAWH